MISENAGKKQDTRFKRGQSGNPAGKPKGTRNKATLAVEALLDGEAEVLTRKAVELALEGDVTALRLCLERLCPPRKERPLEAGAVRLPTLKPENMAEASAAIVRAVVGGRLDPTQGESLAKLLEQHRKALELQDIEQRLTAIEQAMEHR